MEQLVVIFITGVITAIIVGITCLYFLAIHIPLKPITATYPVHSIQSVVPSTESRNTTSDTRFPGPSEDSDVLKTLFTELDNPKIIHKSVVISEPSNTQNTPVPIKSGGYVLMDNLNARNILRSPEDTAAIKQFSYLLTGKSYQEAVDIAKNAEYTLHILYVGYPADASKKMARSAYSPKVIGVRIKDPNFERSNNTPSSAAIITEIIDIGGLDINDLGIIKL